ncbi:MAG: PHP domain-containing protein [Acidimicrobiia bacterium]|nr:PHP domain-containing protein [Acidimicrobiia bacterium]
MAVDLHTHSLYSDGTDTPAELVRLARRAGLTALALTDHDTLDGIPEGRTAATGAPLQFVPGVELSVDWEMGSAHLLAYWIEPGPGPLQDRLADLAEGRERRNREILAALAGLGLDITAEELRPTPGVVGRPHIAAALVRRGLVPSMEAAFDLYLARGRPAYRPRLRLQAADAVSLARRSGGAAVLAHPHTVAAGASDYAAALEAFAALGGAGIECHYPDYPPELQAHLAAVTRRLGLVPTGGSDYHGTHRPRVALGWGTGNLEVPDGAVEELSRRVGS